MIAELSPGQQVAKQKVSLWLQDPDPSHIFKLHGYAGTGKTTVIKSFLQDWNGRACFAAFTGKAALVMQRNELPASTIHSLIYKPLEPNKAKCEELFKKIRESTNEGEKRRMQKELEETQKVRFQLKTEEESELAGADLLVLDECSMVNDEILRDLQTFGVPILALGDPGQLPPIDGTGVLVLGQPDSLLTEIHRQAEGNPIIEYATLARMGKGIPYGPRGDEANHILRHHVVVAKMLEVDQIITGKNATRQMLNSRIRGLKGFTSPYPMVGEKLICLRNDKTLGIFNGMMGQVVEVGDFTQSALELKIKMEALPGQEREPIKVSALRAHFDSYRDPKAIENVRWWERSNNQEFDWGYAITVHKSQGSQWDSVLLWDDKFFAWDRDLRRKWLYTGITRAAKNITLVD